MAKNYILVKKVTGDTIAEAIKNDSDGVILEVREIKKESEQLQPIVGALEVEVTEGEFDEWERLGFKLH